ncbi:hypothetical protein NST74_07510 [Paenibacillus sp. FSL F4-0125]|uniref:hypothetical protein n=1 Tax=Paenibacillus sp. FSL F4-0125 TaxID=2954730 RepID=UPI0030FC7E4B
MMVLTTRALAASGKQVKASGALNVYLDEASISSYAKDSIIVDQSRSCERKER